MSATPLSTSRRQSNPPEIVILGFPKCGTTALTTLFEKDPDILTLRTPDGSIEMSWPTIRDLQYKAAVGKIVAHKYTAYIYNPEALKYLVEVNSRSQLVLCIRDPRKALISWHRMHYIIATSGRDKKHFAYRERDFYDNCSIEDYYDHFAKKRLNYAKYFRQLLSLAPRERIVVIAQERMAEGIDGVGEYLKNLAVGKDASPPNMVYSGEIHRGYADRESTPLPSRIATELEHVLNDMSDTIRESGVRAHV